MNQFGPITQHNASEGLFLDKEFSTNYANTPSLTKERRMTKFIKILSVGLFVLSISQLASTDQFEMRDFFNKKQILKENVLTLTEDEEFRLYVESLSAKSPEKAEKLIKAIESLEQEFLTIDHPSPGV